MSAKLSLGMAEVALFAPAVSSEMRAVFFVYNVMMPRGRTSAPLAF